MLPLDLEKIRNQHRDMEEFVIKAHHLFMKKYGWIPLEEFRKMPLSTFLNLWKLIADELEQEEKAIRGLKHGRRNP